MTELHPLIEYRAALEGNRQVFWLNHSDAFHAFRQIDEDFAKILQAITSGRDVNNKTRAHVIPMLLFMQRQMRSAFDLLSTYRSYEAWVVVRPALELALMLGKFEDDPTTFELYQNRRRDIDAYRKAFSGKGLRSRCLPRSSEIQEVLRRVNDDFVHANSDYFKRHFVAEHVGGGNLGLKVEYTDDDNDLAVNLWAFLHLLVVIQDGVAGLLNGAFVNARAAVSGTAAFEAAFAPKVGAYAMASAENRRCLEELGLWRFGPHGNASVGSANTSGPGEVTFANLTATLGRVAHDLTTAAHIDDVFWQVQAIIGANSAINTSDIFQDWIADTYVDSIVVRLRRLIDRRDDSVSLYRLLEAMKPAASWFTRIRFVDQWPEGARDVAHKRFDLIAGTGESQLAPAVLAAKQDELRVALRCVQRYANKNVTHTAVVPLAAVTSYSEVRESLAAAFRIFNWCSLVLNNSTYVTAVPVPQSNWLSVFETPWRVPGTPVPPYRHLDDLVHQP